MSANALHDLLTSLTKAEKRHVLLFLRRNKPESNLLKLYTELVSGKKKSLSSVNLVPNQAVVSNYLYDQVLNALCLLHKEQSVDSKIRALITEAELLFHRSLYSQSIDKINSALKLAITNEKFNAEHELIELKRRIRQRIDKLDNPAGELESEWKREQILLNLNRNKINYRYFAYEIFQLSRKEAVVRDPKNLEKYNEILNTELFLDESNADSFQAKIDLYNSKAIYFRATRDFDNLYLIRKKIYQLMASYPEITKETPGVYLSSMNNLIIACFHKENYDEGYSYINDLKNYKVLNEDERRRLFINISSLELGYYDYTGKIQEGVVAAQLVEEELNRLFSKLSVHNRIALLFNLAQVYFRAGQNKQASRCLSKIMNEKSEFRIEIRVFSRLMQLLIFLEQGEYELLNSLLRSSVRFLNKSSRFFKFESLVLEWIQTVKNNGNLSQNDLLKLKVKLDALKDSGDFKKTDDLIGLDLWLEKKTVS